jgi:hypothetical protein
MLCWHYKVPATTVAPHRNDCLLPAQPPSLKQLPTLITYRIDRLHVNRLVRFSRIYFFCLLLDTSVRSLTLRLLSPCAYCRGMCRILVMRMILLAILELGFVAQHPTFKAQKNSLFLMHLRVGQSAPQ